jgi:hypothetical protein
MQVSFDVAGVLELADDGRVAALRIIHGTSGPARLRGTNGPAFLAFWRAR